MTTSPGECVDLVTVAIRNILPVSTSTLCRDTTINKERKGESGDSGIVGNKGEISGIVGKKGERVG